MREIKFRIWDAKYEQMYPAATMQRIFRAANSPGANAAAVEALGNHWDDCIWLQYTGLKDKNGVKIYEGDIVATDFKASFVERGVVEYRSTEYVMARGSFVDSLTSLTRAKWTLEVIGNIYENPELLQLSKP